MHPTPLRRLAALTALLALLLSACAGGDDAATTELDLDDFAAIEEAADGQTVRWWLFGGDDRINGYIDDNVVPAAAELGVTLERVELTDTADAVNRVLSEVRAGEDDGSVDMIWINGANFANGREADLWLDAWAPSLPNAAFVDPATVATDFGVPVDGQESPWSRALFVYAHDTAALPQPPTTFEELAAYAAANPGRVTYPAPPDFTGSAFVRQVVQALGEDEAMTFLADLAPDLWRGGEAYPGNEAELNELFGNGEVDVAMSYDPAFVETAVAQGRFPDTARPFVLEAGTLQNVSYVTIPRNAANLEGALVVANLLLDPRLQAIKADPSVLGVPTVLDLARLDDDQRALFVEATGSPFLLDDYGTLLEELPAERVGELDQRWLDEVLGG